MYELNILADEDRLDELDRIDDRLAEKHVLRETGAVYEVPDEKQGQWMHSIETLRKNAEAVGMSLSERPYLRPHRPQTTADQALQDYLGDEELEERDGVDNELLERLFKAVKDGEDPDAVEPEVYGAGVELPQQVRRNRYGFPQPIFDAPRK